MPTAKRETEEAVQITVVEWLRAQYPDAAACMHHSPNEGNHKVQYRVKQQRMGVSKGFPDLLIFVPKGPFVGLAIEIKAEDGKKPKIEQFEWLDRLNEAGWMATWCKGFDACVDTIKAYLEQAD